MALQFLPLSMGDKIERFIQGSKIRRSEKGRLVQYMTSVRPYAVRGRRWGEEGGGSQT